MKRKITLSIELVLSVVLLSLVSFPATAKAKQRGRALAFPKTAAAAPKQHCTITPSGPAQFLSNLDVYGGNSGSVVFGVAATWNGTLHCDNPTPLEGSTVEVRQRLVVRVQNGRAMGPTEILLGLIYGGDNRLEFHFDGRVQGDVTCDVEQVPADVCKLSLETRANGPGGSHLRGSAIIEVDATTHEVESFTPGPLEFVPSGDYVEFQGATQGDSCEAGCLPEQIAAPG